MVAAFPYVYVYVCERKHKKNALRFPANELRFESIFLHAKQSPSWSPCFKTGQDCILRSETRHSEHHMSRQDQLESIK